jgi:hypothetical protein
MVLGRFEKNLHKCDIFSGEPFKHIFAHYNLQLIGSTFSSTFFKVKYSAVFF